jgi:hypothetical protein
MRNVRMVVAVRGHRYRSTPSQVRATIAFSGIRQASQDRTRRPEDQRTDSTPRTTDLRTHRPPPIQQKRHPMSRADDGARSLDGLTDRGVTSHGVCRASHLRVGQQLECGSDWHTIKAVKIEYGEVTAKSATMTWCFTEASLVKVRDILHTYTESETP